MRGYTPRGSSTGGEPTADTSSCSGPEVKSSRPLGCCYCCCCCCCRTGGPTRRTSAGRLHCPGGPRIALWLRRMLCLGGSGSPSPSAASLGASATNAASDTLLLDSEQEFTVVQQQRRSSTTAVQVAASSSESSEPLQQLDTSSALYIRMIGPSPGSSPPGGSRGSRASSGAGATSLSDADWLLLEGLDTRQQRPLHTGRFLTMHKRRRKRLVTRSGAAASLGGGGPALLDDVLHGQVQCVLDRVGDWPFNAFILDTVTGGRSLPVLCIHLFHWYGLMDHFKLDPVHVWKLFTLIEEGYHGTNPYHNAIHAADVTQAMHCFLQEEKIREHLTPLEIMASLLAAVTHDLDHPGVNQPFLIATSNHLAALYENTSVLENHHWRSAIGCLLESCVADQLGPSRESLEQQISSLILATDITRQQEFLTRFKRYLDCDMLDMRQEQDRHFILQIALKCADISNPCRPWDISKKWSQKVCEEFFRQGDYERRLNLPVTSLCDRHTTSVPKIQAGFFNYVVSPLMEEWRTFLVSPLALNMMDHLRDNQTRWETLLNTELAEETKTEVSEAVDDIDDEELAQLESLQPTPSRSLHLPAGAGRRHSMPLSLPRLPTARTIIRRESLPAQAAGPRFPSETILHLEREEESDTLSLFSEHGSGSVRSLGPPLDVPRPLSADTLLPESSIASITTSSAASRLSSVLHPVGPGGRCLTRQQTFPPLHPSVHAARMRHLPSTASEALQEASDSSTSTPSCHTEPREQPPKREPPPELERSDRTKMAKLEGKENRAPSDKLSGTSHRKTIQGNARLQCRRGSAPVGLCKLDDSLRASPPIEYRLSRRGSVPSDGSRQSVLRALAPPCMLRRASLPYDPCAAAATAAAAAAAAAAANTRPNLSANAVILPADTSDHAKMSQGLELMAALSEASWGSRKRLLRRRFSAGGPEGVQCGEPAVMDPVLHERLVKRRGSLPAELRPRPSGASSEGSPLPRVSS